MARAAESRYIQYNYYTAGSAARQPELPQIKPRRKARPKAAPQTRANTGLRITVVAAAVVVALVLCMALCAWQYISICNQTRAMAEYVSELQAEQVSLQREYESKLNLAEIRLAAESMGLVPSSEVAHITISRPVIQPAEQPSFWQQLWEQVVYFFS